MKELNNIDKALKDFLAKTKNKAVGDSIPQMQQQITQNVINSFAPVIQQLADQAKISKDDLASVLKEIQIVAPEARIPEIRIPEIKVPTPQVTVNVPKGETPIVNVAPTPVTFPDSMRLSGIDNKNPLPMLMVGVDGKPVSFSMGASGGRGDFFTIKDIQTSSGASLIDQVEGAMKVTGNFSVTASGATTVSLINSDGNYYNSDNPLPVTGSFSSTPFATYYASDAVGSVNVVQSITLDVKQLSGSIDSVYVTGVASTLATNLIDSSGVAYSGSNPVPVSGSVAVSGVTNSIQATIIDSSGVGYSGSNPVPVTGTVAVSGVTNSIASALIDSGGSQYSTSNPLPINTVAGGPDSMFIYRARTTNPTAVGDGADVRPSTDKLGRTLNRPVQVRDLLLTAYASLSTGTEATLLTASAGTYLDLVAIVMSNQSTASVQVDVRAVSGGNIVQTFQVPANSTVGVNLTTPWPQDATGNAWTVDMPDITGTTVNISALFSKES